MAGSGESSPVAWYSDDDGLVLAAVMTSQSRFDFFGHESIQLNPKKMKIQNPAGPPIPK